MTKKIDPIRPTDNAARALARELIAGSSHGALAVIALVGQNMVRPQSGEQALDLGNFVAFAAGQDEADRASQGVGCSMDLSAQPALGASQRVSIKPIFGSIAFFGAPALC